MVAKTDRGKDQKDHVEYMNKWKDGLDTKIHDLAKETRLEEKKKCTFQPKMNKKSQQIFNSIKNDIGRDWEDGVVARSKLKQPLDFDNRDMYYRDRKE